MIQTVCDQFCNIVHFSFETVFTNREFLIVSFQIPGTTDETLVTCCISSDSTRVILGPYFHDTLQCMPCDLNNL